MKQGKTLTQLAAEIDRQSNAKRDIIAPTKKLRVHPPHQPDWMPSVSLNLHGENAYAPIKHHALRQMGTWAGIPAKYVDRMHNDAPLLLATNMNHWLEESTERRMVRYLDGEARAWLSDRYRRIDHGDILKSVLPVIMNEAPSVRVGSAEVTEHRMYVKLVFPFLESEVFKGSRLTPGQGHHAVQQGDLVQAALVITNSEVGSGSFNIQPAVFTYTCTNLLISKATMLRRTHVGRRLTADDGYDIWSDDTLKADDAALQLKMRDVVRHALKADVFHNHVAALEASAGRHIDGHPEAAVRELGQQVGLLETELGGVLRHFIDAGDLTQYGLVNAVTRHAQDVPDYDRATALEETGHTVLTLPPSQWKAIAAAA